MSHQLKKEYLKGIRERYLEANKSKKSMILDEFCEVCGYARKYAIAILNGHINPTQKLSRAFLKSKPNMSLALQAPAIRARSVSEGSRESEPDSILLITA
jgi:hypothetical protein